MRTGGSCDSHLFKARKEAFSALFFRPRMADQPARSYRAVCGGAGMLVFCGYLILPSNRRRRQARAAEMAFYFSAGADIFVCRGAVGNVFERRPISMAAPRGESPRHQIPAPR